MPWGVNIGLILPRSLTPGTREAGTRGKQETQEPRLQGRGSPSQRPLMTPVQRAGVTEAQLTWLGCEGPAPTQPASSQAPWPANRWLVPGARVWASPLSSSAPAGRAGRLGQGGSTYCGRLFMFLWRKPENEDLRISSVRGHTNFVQPSLSFM